MPSEAKIVLDSVAPSGARLTTFQITIPRIVLAEFNTHKMISKNSASSRAIPVKKKIDRVTSDPFFPKAFGKNAKGMQPSGTLSLDDDARAKQIWASAIVSAVSWADALADIGVHKQLANRLIEFADYQVIVATGTEWSNMFALRDHPQAQDEIRDPMHEAKELYAKSEPQKLKEGEWHLPYVTGYDVGEPMALWADSAAGPGTFFEGKATWTQLELVQMSAGRCAAVSYLNQENQLDPAGDIRRTIERLIPNGHMSPTEHPAQALTHEEWVHFGMQQAMRWVLDRVPVGNLWGWRQFRKTIENEHDFSLLASQ